MNLSLFKFILILLVIIYLIYQSSRKIIFTRSLSNYFVFLLMAFVFTFDLTREIYQDLTPVLPIIAQSIFVFVFIIWFFIFVRRIKK
jgi:hypothetical protein